MMYTWVLASQFKIYVFKYLSSIRQLNTFKAISDNYTNKKILSSIILKSEQKGTSICWCYTIRKALQIKCLFKQLDLEPGTRGTRQTMLCKTQGLSTRGLFIIFFDVKVMLLIVTRPFTQICISLCNALNFHRVYSP